MLSKTFQIMYASSFTEIPKYLWTWQSIYTDSEYPSYNKNLFNHVMRTCPVIIVILYIHSQDSPHIVKTGRLDFSLSLSWLEDEVRENLGDFRKSIQILTFLSPLLHVPLPFTKTNVLHYDLKKDAINEFGIKYWTWNPVGHISGTWELLLCEYWRKSMIIGEKNTDLKRLTKD
jgi:hypothetical protein